tara:strand:+ start:253 stop:486 length:234 start_codon:yes stop_codon:yes gene_type:complete
MHAESNCIYEKLGHGKVLTSHEIHHALDQYCNWANLSTLAGCKTKATEYTGMLIHNFGSNGTIDKQQFYKGFVTVKG